ncbi:MAG: hypothetical protein P8174_09755 [Gemmatimonadota bacterium]
MRAPGADSAGSGAQGAQQALMQRPVLSIRTRVVVVFVVLFALLSSVTAAAVVSLSAFEAKIMFLESAGSYSTEIEEARRNEKNFFLYGTGLPEAMAAASVAHNHLRRGAEQMRWRWMPAWGATSRCWSGWGRWGRRPGRGSGEPSRCSCERRARSS